MIKRYCATCSKFSVYLDLEDGRNIKISFEGKNTITKERFADVTDPLIQKALENNEHFGSYFYLSNEFQWAANQDPEQLNGSVLIPGLITENELPKTVQDEGPREIVKKEFKNSTEAKNWLNKECKIPLGQLGNKVQIVKNGLEKGFDITFLTDQYI